MAATAGLPARPGFASSGAGAWIAARWRPVVAVALILGVAAALGIATYRSGWLPQRAGDAANRMAQKLGQGASSVAGLFNLRSPGERASGALARLKVKLPPLHQRALPKVRRPVSPLAGVVAAPPVPPAASVPPLYNIVAPPPKSAVPALPVALTPSGGALGGVFPAITPLPGGGVIVPPPAIAPPSPPPDVPVVVPLIPGTPGIPGVPEPTTWAMMLLGFVLIGSAVRRQSPSFSR